MVLASPRQRSQGHRIAAAVEWGLPGALPNLEEYVDTNAALAGPVD